MTKLYDSCEYIIKEHDDCDIHKIIGYQNGSQRTFRIITQHLYFLIGISLFILKFRNISW